MSNNKNCVFVIPAYNEEATIKTVVKQALVYSEVIVIDDCSTDETKNIVLNTSARLFSNNENIGYERSIVEGLNRAISLGFKYAITLDGDGQLNPSYFREFYTTLLGCDMVIGIRNSKPRFSEKIAGFISFVLFRVNDPFCGLKGYNLELLKKTDNLFSTNSIGTELFLRMAKGRRKIKQIKINVNKRNGHSTFGKNSFYLNLKFLYYFIRTLFTTKPI